VRGYRLFEEGTRELAIRVVCQVRGKEVPPTSPEFTFEVIERNWGDGLMRVLHHAISRLVHLHYDELLGTCYEHYGRVDADGLPYQATVHTPFGRHFCHTEALLHQTQEHLDHVRMVADERGLELAILREDLQESISSRHRLLSAKRKIVKKNKTLRRRVRELEDNLASLESHVSELEGRPPSSARRTRRYLAATMTTRRPSTRSPLAPMTTTVVARAVMTAMLSLTYKLLRLLVRRTPRS
jgi:hypothetical protein